MGVKVYLGLEWVNVFGGFVGVVEVVCELFWLEEGVFEYLDVRLLLIVDWGV